MLLQGLEVCWLHLLRLLAAVRLLLLLCAGLLTAAWPTQLPSAAG
jgi:hypothetical protein